MHLLIRMTMNELKQSHIRGHPKYASCIKNLSLNSTPLTQRSSSQKPIPKTRRSGKQTSCPGFKQFNQVYADQAGVPPHSRGHFTFAEAYKLVNP
jgi:hypothetical protein